MKIIQKGPLFQTPWLLAAECSECDTQVEVERDDVQRTWQEADRPDESTGFIYYWVCPLCDEDNYIWAENKDTMLTRFPELKKR